MNVDKTIDSDVLVIGGGGAALRAAVAAHDAGAGVIVALKGKMGKCGATVSPDSRGVAWQMADKCANASGADAHDSPEVYYRNILATQLMPAVRRRKQLDSNNIPYG